MDPSSFFIPITNPTLRVETTTSLSYRGSPAIVFDHHRLVLANLDPQQMLIGLRRNMEET